MTFIHITGTILQTALPPAVHADNTQRVFFYYHGTRCKTNISNCLHFADVYCRSS